MLIGGLAMNDTTKEDYHDTVLVGWRVFHGNSCKKRSFPAVAMFRANSIGGINEQLFETTYFCCHLFR